MLPDTVKLPDIKTSPPIFAVEVTLSVDMFEAIIMLLAKSVLMPALLRTFSCEPVPVISNIVFARNEAPLPSVRVFAVVINACVATNHCWKVFAVVSWTIAITYSLWPASYAIGF